MGILAEIMTEIRNVLYF